jgi:hypothetical protein
MPDTTPDQRAALRDLAHRHLAVLSAARRPSHLTPGSSRYRLLRVAWIEAMTPGPDHDPFLRLMLEATPAAEGPRVRPWPCREGWADELEAN